MARYIDADKLWNDRPLIPEGKNQDYGAGFSECMWGFSKLIRKQIDNTTADVVPKSEVERLTHKCDDCAGCTQWKCDCANIELEVAREIFEEIEEYAELQIESLNIAAKVDLSGADFFGGGKQAFVLLLDRLAELKKKYTEGKE